MGKKSGSEEHNWSFTKNIFRVILFSSLTISLAVIITGILGYNSTKNAIIHKAKTQDIVFTVKSMASEIEGRINRAVETSYIFARDPLYMKWLEGKEQDKEIGNVVTKKLEEMAGLYDYSNSFIVGVQSNHYYYCENLGKNGKKRGSVILSKDNSADSWFYEILALKRQLYLNVNYDRAMDDTFLFVNVLMGNVDKPAGICGVGLSLKDISKEFGEFKVGKKSSLWMIDENGMIQLSAERKDIGKNYETFLSKKAVNEIRNAGKLQNIKVSEYTDEHGQVFDYAFCKLNSTDWVLVYKIPRQESISIISSLRTNMVVTVLLVLICFVILFYFISKKIANPYKHTMLINKELEEKVEIRTKELQESNQKIMDSIQYAKRLQESILPSKEDMQRLLEDYFVIWRPRDIVGGDFYWLREAGDVTILAVGDCTGHGVPGALMTMTVNAILHHIVMNMGEKDPSSILKELHIRLKETLNKSDSPEAVDDGLDIAIFCIKDKSSMLYAGANIDLAIKSSEEIKLIKAQSKGVGYNYIEIKESLQSEEITIHAGDSFIAATDGFIHQNGGPKNFPFGKRRFYEMLQQCENDSLKLMKEKCEAAIGEYMGIEPQRDDITVLAFKIK